MTIKSINQTGWILIAALFGVAASLTEFHYILSAAKVVSKIFINLLELISIPLIFLSIVSTISGMENFDTMKTIGKKVLFYTLLTTLIAAAVGLILFLLINPLHGVEVAKQVAHENGALNSYYAFLSKIIPTNLVQLFGSNANVTGIVFFAILLSVAILYLPREQKNFLHTFFSSFFQAILKITSFILAVMPLGVWSFVTLFVYELTHNTTHLKHLALYVVCIIVANIIQGAVVLPLLLKYKGLSPLKVARGMSKALAVAFFSKSSNTTLPLTIKCAQEELGVSERVASFTLPLCSTINMNGCAAFILITVLFVSMHSGIVFSPLDMIVWIVIASIAAVGNAGVPMGCYFLSSAFLAGMNVPLYLLGAILPLYTVIDMVETMLNVWSDSCVAVIVDKEMNK